MPISVHDEHGPAGRMQVLSMKQEAPPESAG